MKIDKPTNRFDKCACACCGYFTISDTYDICPVCYWEQDWYQETYELDWRGPNHVSLADAIKNFKTYGASEWEYIKRVRKPNGEEQAI